MKEIAVVTCFLTHRGRILLLKRSDRVGSYRGRWAGVSGYMETEPDAQALVEIFEETGLAAGVGGHPALGIVWLARRYADQGLSLRAGQVVLAGSFTRPVDVRPGDEFAFDYGPLGRFTLGFT